mmetsp:Transcript_49688/g.153509  ORF Transcript_49688/g.153509 Transcript_49688/m.153509 type:complete len:296 (-) Transcript_49688:430-1317(-)
MERIVFDGGIVVVRRSAGRRLDGIHLHRRRSAPAHFVVVFFLLPRLLRCNRLRLRGVGCRHNHVKYQVHREVPKHEVEAQVHKAVHARQVRHLGHVGRDDEQVCDDAEEGRHGRHGAVRVARVDGKSHVRHHRQQRDAEDDLVDVVCRRALQREARRRHRRLQPERLVNERVVVRRRAEQRPADDVFYLAGRVEVCPPRASEPCRGHVRERRDIDPHGLFVEREIVKLHRRFEQSGQTRCVREPRRDRQREERIRQPGCDGRLHRGRNDLEHVPLRVRQRQVPLVQERRFKEQRQ